MIECEKCGAEIDEEYAVMCGEQIYCERCYKDACEWERADMEIDDMCFNMDYYY